MPFFRASLQFRHDCSIGMSDGKVTEMVPLYKYLGKWIDDKLLSNVHIANLIRKPKMKSEFNFRNKSCFTFNAKKLLAASIFRSSESVDRASLCFITNVPYSPLYS